MSLLKYKIIVPILLIAGSLAVLFLNFVFDIYPVYGLLNYLDTKNLFWIIPLSILILSLLWFFSINTKRKIINERIRIFNATIRTVQDILQNSHSSIQLLILDMKDEGVNDEIVSRAGKNIDELKELIKALASIDPETIELKELNRRMSIIKMKND